MFNEERSFDWETLTAFYRDLSLLNQRRFLDDIRTRILPGYAYPEGNYVTHSTTLNCPCCGDPMEVTITLACDND